MSNQYIFYRKEGVLRKIEPLEIVFLEISNNYTRVCTLKEEHLIRISLAEALSLLPEGMFAQVHRSFIVNLEHVDSIGRASVLFAAHPELEIPVSRRYYAELMKQIVILEQSSAAIVDGEPE